ncbi:MAG: EamA/RhaT family transporter, partial [Eubacteriales bacterium]|nr:EamA/RhaT family transporter [Eubacteriales bacterium]
GAAKTSAYYAIAPFVGALLSFAILGEAVGTYYLLALLIMLAGSALSVVDTLMVSHAHTNAHAFTYTHNGTSRSHTITHSNAHRHRARGKKCRHRA